MYSVVVSGLYDFLLLGDTECGKQSLLVNGDGFNSIEEGVVSYNIVDHTTFNCVVFLDNMCPLSSALGMKV